MTFLKHRIVICGLPRSGTTIVARFAELAGASVLHEPFQSAALSGFTPEFWEYLLRQCLSKSNAVLIKEPFHTIPKQCQCLNADILKRLDASGWKFVFVTRSLKDNFASQKAWAHYGNVHDFILNHSRFSEFVAGRPSIDYDRFCMNPAHEWNSIAKELPIGESFEMKPMPATPIFMGDVRASISTSIEKLTPGIELTQSEVDALSEYKKDDAPSDCDN